MLLACRRGPLDTSSRWHLQGGGEGGACLSWGQSLRNTDTSHSSPSALIEIKACVRIMSSRPVFLCHFERDSELFRVSSEEAALSLWLPCLEQLKERLLKKTSCLCTASGEHLAFLGSDP